MHLALAPTLLLLLACTSPPPANPTAEILRFHELSGSVADHPEQCASFVDPAIRRDCIDMAAAGRAVARGTAAGLAVCELHQGETFWTEECVFAVADAGELVGQEALDVCNQAGSLRRRCLGHAVRRTVLAQLEPFRLGEEAARMEAAAQAAAVLVSPKKARVVTRKAAAGLIRQRFDDGFAREDCGQAEPALCAEAYQQVIIDALAKDTEAGSDAAQRTLEKLCPVPMARDAVEAAGLLGWDPSAEEVAQLAWRVLCADAASPRRSRRWRHGGKAPG